MKKLFAILVSIIMLACSSFALAESEQKSSLPAYVYPGEDRIVGAVANYLAENAPQYWEEGVDYVAIPAPVILKTAMIDNTHADVYGNFWCMQYTLEGSTLLCISGGEAPGVMHLEMADQVWTVLSVETARDGDYYAPDIIRFCNGDKELENAYFNSTDALKDPLRSVRARFIREYVEANQLAIDSYQDPYWDPEPLFE